VGFTRDELESFRDTTVPDLVGPQTRLLFVGINPGLWTAATQTHFAHPSNRFYRALWLAGIVDQQVDPSAGMTDADRAHFLARGLGITNLVARATAKASELSIEELRAGGRDLRQRIAAMDVRAVAVAGLTAYRTAFEQRRAVGGRQPADLMGVPTWVVPNPSGLNAHETAASLARAYREPAEFAGVPLSTSRL
jgi:TDG/mug DNA glycosylase family protein